MIFYMIAVTVHAFVRRFIVDRKLHLSGCKRSWLILTHCKKIVMSFEVFICSCTRSLTLAANYYVVVLFLTNFICVSVTKQRLLIFIVDNLYYMALLPFTIFGFFSIRCLYYNTIRTTMFPHFVSMVESLDYRLLSRL